MNTYTARRASTRSAPRICRRTGFPRWKGGFQRQQEVFAAQLELANRLGLPVVVHDREAHADTLSFLEKYRPRGVVHCFSGSLETARQVLGLGLYIGLGGVVTFKNARHAVDVAREIPLDRLLLETDAPYMAPVSLRKSRKSGGKNLKPLQMPPSKTQKSCSA